MKIKELNPRIYCADGVSLSVQGNQYAYCSPRIDDVPTWQAYTLVEVGYITDANEKSMAPPDTWREYGDGEFPSSVYGYVPTFAISGIGGLRMKVHIPKQEVLDALEKELKEASWGSEVSREGANHDKYHDIMTRTNNQKTAGSSITPCSAFGVICRSRAEAIYMIEWCDAKGWLPPTLNVDLIAKFPWVACLDFDRGETAWTDHLDRAMAYKTFAEFIELGLGGGQ